MALIHAAIRSHAGLVPICAFPFPQTREAFGTAARLCRFKRNGCRIYAPNKGG
jgi:hypothetical protein